MKSSPSMRVLMAAGLYLLLMWGYMILQSPQIFAVFTALIMSIALVFWVGEARVDLNASSDSGEPLQCEAGTHVSAPAIEPTLDASIQRLDTLKADLTLQYAQFGRDQSLLNCKGLGTWHPDGGQRGCGK